MKNHILTTLFMMKFLVLLGLSSPLKAGDDMPAMESKPAVASKGEHITVLVVGPYSQQCKDGIMGKFTKQYPDIVEKIDVELNSEKDPEVRKTKVSKVYITTKAGSNTLTDKQIKDDLATPFNFKFQKSERSPVE